MKERSSKPQEAYNMERNMDKMEPEMEMRRSRKGAWFWLFILVIAAVAVILWQFDILPIGRSADEYQAVFLTNNQVYFGKLLKASSQYPVLTDVYYLQVTQALQPRAQNAPAANNINLVKLGGEIHGPVDEMVINRDHILFYEDLKSDSQVTVAIKQFKENQDK